MKRALALLFVVMLQAAIPAQATTPPESQSPCPQGPASFPGEPVSLEGGGPVLDVRPLPIYQC
ncbi:hypothetical protein [Deinococcus cellulosilyticus]|uniref:Uncharacterized protein n=1 Tax=Deinococcus cellulosilyticus (strain DSM 18568 / NBRC 106333 / KACC 11606 / 5516J-15) TaxID=1223518 RepID=A0A511N0A8_DEIC1|nr:hypothetical protein [Deinococcus cellulosilyticus]GEM46249.1 hypothetical protein DC3_18840 [Deinococcus cellulosilyticus NBRC 106333 = KACC 11606]